MYIALLVGGLLLILCGVGYGGVVDIHVMMMFGGDVFSLVWVWSGFFNRICWLQVYAKERSYFVSRNGAIGYCMYGIDLQCTGVHTHPTSPFLM